MEDSFDCTDGADGSMTSWAVSKLSVGDSSTCAIDEVLGALVLIVGRKLDMSAFSVSSVSSPTFVGCDFL